MRTGGGLQRHREPQVEVGAQVGEGRVTRQGDGIAPGGDGGVAVGEELRPLRLQLRREHGRRGAALGHGGLEHLHRLVRRVALDVPGRLRESHAGGELAIQRPIVGEFVGGTLDVGRQRRERCERRER